MHDKKRLNFPLNFWRVIFLASFSFIEYFYCLFFKVFIIFTIFYFNQIFFISFSFFLNVFQQSCFLKKKLHIIFYSSSMEILGCVLVFFTFRLSLIANCNWNIRYALKRRYILTKWGYYSRQNLPALWLSITSLGDTIYEMKTISTCCNNSRQQPSLFDFNNNHYVINTFPHLT